MPHPTQPRLTTSYTSWLRRNAAPVAALTAVAALGAGAGVAFALWSDTAGATTALRSGMVVFDVNDADHDRTLAAGTGGYFGGLKSNPDDVTSFTLPTAALIEALEGGETVAVAVGVDALTDGPFDVTYSLTGADDGAGATTAFADNVTVTVLSIAPGTACAADTTGTPVYTGLLSGIDVPGRPLVSAASTPLAEAGTVDGTAITRRWRSGSEVLCLQLTARLVDYENEATATGTSAGGTITAKDEWSGEFFPELDDGASTVLHFAPAVTQVP